MRVKAILTPEWSDLSANLARPDAEYEYPLPVKFSSLFGPENLESAGEKVQPIFITVDPARDTVESLAKYVVNFHPRLTALTGSEAQILAVADAYKVYFSKGEELDAVDDYVVDHTDIMYFMGPDGALLEYFQTGRRPVDIAQAIGRHL